MPIRWGKTNFGGSTDLRLVKFALLRTLFDFQATPAVHAPKAAQSLIFPVQMSLYITQSPMKLYSGRLKLAGLFFSKTKWPTQAKP